jgi:hypothetical protein
MANETELLKKVAILLFFLELGGVILSYFLNTGIAIPAITQLNGYINSTESTAATIGGVGNYTPVSQIPPSGTFAVFQEIANIFAQIINATAKVVYFIIEILVLIADGIGIMVFSLFVLIPSLLTISSLGSFGVIFGLGYAVLFIVLGIYAFELITSIYRRVKP